MSETSYIVGLDINNEEAQICVYVKDKKEVRSAPFGIPASKCAFPARLLYFPRNGKWKFGEEADFFAGQNDAVMISDILKLCENKRDLFVAAGVSMSPGRLLSELIRSLLGLAGIKNPKEGVLFLSAAVPEVTPGIVSAFKEASDLIGIKGRAKLCSYDESFYYQALCEKPESFRNKAGLFNFGSDGSVSFEVLNVNRQTKPVTAFVEKKEGFTLPKDNNEKDAAFIRFAEALIGKDYYTAIYLVGKGFDKKWSLESSKWLTRQGRRAFYGDNFFASGACFAAKEALMREKTLAGYLFLGDDILTDNIGINLLSDGKPVYVPLIRAGEHWYEAGGGCEMIPADNEKLVFSIDSIKDGKHKDVIMPLPGFPKRPLKASRLGIEAACSGKDESVITVRDLGFGELFPSSKKVWTDRIRKED